MDTKNLGSKIHKADWELFLLNNKLQEQPPKEVINRRLKLIRKHLTRALAEVQKLEELNNE